MNNDANTDEADAIKWVAGQSQSLRARKERQNRQQRERDAQLVALGVLLTQRGSLEEMQPGDFLDSGVAAVVEALKAVAEKPAESLRITQAKEWMSQHLGVDAEDSEKLQEAVLRTVKENRLRAKAADVVGVMQLMAGNWHVGDAAYIAELKKRVAEL